ncbi:MAG TPA: OmpA family protein, partial [Hyphomicrobiales bacterium]|nr:OmpA family protein [Hyphomicrobiales bacterium]
AELSGSGLSFSGAAADAASYDAYRAALAELPAGYALVSDTVAPPPVSPYVWSAERHGKALALAGSMPDDAARAALAGAISRAFPGSGIADGTTPASGAPEEFDIAIAMALDALSRLEDGAVTITDKELSIRGRARHFDSEADLRAALATGLPPGFSVTEFAISPPAVSPFTFSAATADGALRLAGYVPDEAARAAIRDAAAGLGLAVDDRLVVAGGAPEGFLDAARAALSALAGLAPGRAELSGMALSVSGKAPSAEVLAKVNATLDTGLPAGVTLAGRDIEGPPPPPAPEPEPVETPAVEAAPAPATVPDGWTMELGETGIVLVGRVPDEAARSAILAHVSRLFPDRAIDDRLVVADGAPQGFAAAVEAAIDALGRLVTGRAAVLDGTIELTGEAYNERAIDEILDLLKRALPQGFTTAGGLRVAAPAAEVAATECQQLLSGLLSNNTIHFESAQSVIAVESYGLLDALAFASQRCPAARIEIGGHTDADGAEDANLALSEARAAAVRDYLVRAGVAVDRLDARGYGEAEPVADNATEEGKAKNRRTEFRIEQ